MNNNSINWRYYEDIQIGEERHSKSLIVYEKEIIEFANKYDPQWFHNDPNASQNSSFKGLIASGIHVAAIWRLLDHDANGDIKFVCGIGWEKVRWQNPLRPNDEVFVWSRCLSKSDTSSKEKGVVIFDHGLKRKDQIDILTFEGTCLVYKKDH